MDPIAIVGLDTMYSVLLVNKPCVVPRLALLRLSCICTNSLI